MLRHIGKVCISAALVPYVAAAVVAVVCVCVARGGGGRLSASCFSMRSASPSRTDHASSLCHLCSWQTIASSMYTWKRAPADRRSVQVQVQVLLNNIMWNTLGPGEGGAQRLSIAATFAYNAAATACRRCMHGMAGCTLATSRWERRRRRRACTSWCAHQEQQQAVQQQQQQQIWQQQQQARQQPPRWTERCPNSCSSAPGIVPSMLPVLPTAASPAHCLLCNSVCPLRKGRRTGCCQVTFCCGAPAWCCPGRHRLRRRHPQVLSP